MSSERKGGREPSSGPQPPSRSVETGRPRSTGGTDRTDATGEAARGVAELERYLLRQTETHNAQQDAVCFAAELPGLTSAQREQIIRLYVHDRRALARRTQELIETALEEHTAELQAAYAVLRRRMCVTVSALITALAFALCLLTLTALV
ncbi:hypothetical protein [Streptomyces sp. 891-h]|uniref:hypothetical protein n=1 Tax=unclassified Streptomyces TaxID=2593676 RepID=UPI001FAA776C|nr:hypothetical protein [Streptomyces sp. 891-h]UNZ16057.1 hypothetical protein HC362_02050 [Streptomyces sp. 891-h]